MGKVEGGALYVCVTSKQSVYGAALNEMGTYQGKQASVGLE